MNNIQHGAMFLAQVDTTWSAGALVTTISLGFLLGAIGQTARVIVGLKKTGDEAKALGDSTASLFKASELVVSLIIGGVAGSLASLAILDKGASLSKEIALGLMAAGYAGADFIEGFMKDASKRSDGRGTAVNEEERDLSSVKVSRPQ